MFLNEFQQCAQSEKQAKSIFPFYYKTILYSFIISFFLFFSVLESFAADRYWVGSAGGAWNDNANWSSSANTCGIGGGASYPVSGG